MDRGSLARCIALAGNDLVLLKKDPALFLLATVVPLCLMMFVEPVFSGLAGTPGFHGNGALQAVPGMAVMFGLFLVGGLGLNFYREHGWGTWTRLRASACSNFELVLGRAVVPFLLAFVNVFLVVGIGSALFDLSIEDGFAYLVVVGASFAVFVTSFNFALVAVCRSLGLFNLLANLSTIILAGLGGALAPITLMPEWMQLAAVLSPAYWGVQGFQSAILGQGELALRSALVLSGFAVGCLVIAMSRFRVANPREGWA